MANIKKLAKDSVKKVSLHNKKLRDCRFIITATTNAALTLPCLLPKVIRPADPSPNRGMWKRRRCSALKETTELLWDDEKSCYENEEFNLLQSSLNIEDGIENLRYNNIVIATDADVDGMHIRLVAADFFPAVFS